MNAVPSLHCGNQLYISWRRYLEWITSNVKILTPGLDNGYFGSFEQLY